MHSGSQWPTIGDEMEGIFFPLCIFNESSFTGLCFWAEDKIC